MNNFFKKILLVITCILLISCNRNEGSSAEPLRDYTEQYNTDITKIEKFLQTHYVEIVNHPGFSDDQDVTFIEIPDGGTQTPIWDMPNLVKDFTVDQNDITYKVYYLKQTEGVGEAPCNVDDVLSAYKGQYLFTINETELVDGVETQVEKLKFNTFESTPNPQSFLSLITAIKGWGEVFPNFKTGTYTSNTDGSVSYNGFGAGIMFLPSALGYYGSSISSIPAYSPLIFNFKLYEIKRNDQDGDGIDSYLEDINNDGYVRVLAEGVVNPDNSDDDEIPDFLDVDDDGDQVSTKEETAYINPSDPELKKRYYPYNGALIDDPLTLYVDETKGIPSCGSSPDYTSSLRLRKHLDPTCQ